jgi:peptidoglycan/xylan/chitin deacetylase (PgdA/CDA1 family)
MACGERYQRTLELSQAEFARWLRGRIERREPAAVIRFGDAEARVLLTEAEDPESLRITIRKLEREAGLSFSAGEALEIKALVAHAFDEADVLGIRLGERYAAEHKVWMDRLADLHAERVAAGRPPTALAHCLLSHQISEELPQLLAGRRVSVISCRELKPVLEADWGLDDVGVYQVPSQCSVRDVDGDYESAMHGVPIWPDAHAHVRAELTVRERGEVFLIGAGLFGKDLCVRVREGGGIALDMGSALDRLAGKATRGPRRRVLDLYAAGRSVDEIVVELERFYGAPVDRAQIAELAAGAHAELAEWRGRTLAQSYSSVCFDRLDVELGKGASLERRVCHLAVGITAAGRRDPLGIWWGEDADPRHWAAVLADLKRRGVREVDRAAIPEPVPEELDRALRIGFPSIDVQAAAEPIESCRSVRKALAARRFSAERDAEGVVYLSLCRAENASRRPAPAIARPVTLSRFELLEWLKQHIDQRLPAALVRFGDSERSLLEARPANPDSIAVARGKLQGATDRRFSTDEVVEIGRAVRRAFEGADVLGILWGRLDKPGASPLTSLYLQQTAAGRRAALLTGCHVSHAILDGLPELLSGRRVSAISCRDVKPVLEGEMGLEDVVVYQVPSQHAVRDVDGAYETGLHNVPIWPDAHARVRAQLTVRERGEVFLVGAGVFGKDLCVDIREGGGVALDMGSALDRMVGKITRGAMRRVRVLHDQGRSVAEIVAHLEDRLGVEVDPEKVRLLVNEEQPQWTSSEDLLSLQPTPPGFHVVRPDPREETVGGTENAPRVVHRGPGRRPEVALTFDDGPSRWTAEIAAAFEKHGCRATFFLRGAAVEELPESVAALATAGHELGNHLWSHANASTQGQGELRSEIVRTADAIQAACGRRPILIRPPYFSAPHAIAEAAAGTGATAVILRSIGTSDWEARSARQIAAPVLANVEPGDIVCMHDGVSPDERDGGDRRATIEAVKRLVPALLTRGLRPVTVSELLRD